MKSSQKEVAKFWGEEATSLMLLEEMGELSQSVVKYLRACNKGKLVPTGVSVDKALDNIAEEMADVRICLDELEYLLGVKDRVKEWGDKKKSREISRMLKEKSEV